MFEKIKWACFEMRSTAKMRLQLEVVPLDGSNIREVRPFFKDNRPYLDPIIPQKGTILFVGERCYRVMEIFYDYDKMIVGIQVFEIETKLTIIKNSYDILVNKEICNEPTNA